MPLALMSALYIRSHSVLASLFTSTERRPPTTEMKFISLNLTRTLKQIVRREFSEKPRHLLFHTKN